MKYSIIGYEVWAGPVSYVPIDDLFAVWNGAVMVSASKKESRELKMTLAKVFGLHREDGPALTAPDGTQEWWVDSTLHREDGPAVINSDGTVEWWLDNALVYDRIEYQLKTGLTDAEMLTMTLKYGNIP